VATPFHQPPRRGQSLDLHRMHDAATPLDTDLASVYHHLRSQTPPPPTPTPRNLHHRKKIEKKSNRDLHYRHVRTHVSGRPIRRRRCALKLGECWCGRGGHMDGRIGPNARRRRKRWSKSERMPHFSGRRRYQEAGNLYPAADRKSKQKMGQKLWPNPGFEPGTSHMLAVGQPG